jgi:Fur family transcriptional regulator, ferric uptake regulator
MSHHTEMVETLRASGHRLTPQRESVLAVIADCQAHLTAEEILRRVRTRYPYLNKSAVYRSLDLLTQIGLVTQTDLGQGRVQYELHEHPHHHHLICRNCGTVSRVDHDSFQPLGKRLMQKYGFQADLDHFAVFGTCRKCQKSED